MHGRHSEKINQKREDEQNADVWDFVYVDRRCWSEFNEDLWCILRDKCEGEALTRVRAASQGMGIKAYTLVYKCFMVTSGMAISERVKQVITPNPPKSE